MKLLERILKAHEKSNDRHDLSVWRTVPRERVDMFHKLIANQQIGDALSSFGTSPVTNGMNAYYINSHPNRLEAHIKEHRRLFLEHTDLTEDNILFPTGYNISGTEISKDTMIPITAYRLGYYANRILNLNFSRKPVILEIGGGWGGLAHIILNNMDVHYVIVDIPTSLMVSSYFLGSTGKNICLYDEYDNVLEAATTHDCTLIPHYAIEEIPALSCDVIINTASLIEMPINSIEYYIEQINRVATRYFYNDNAQNWNFKTLIANVEKLQDFDVSLDQITPINTNVPWWGPNLKRGPKKLKRRKLPFREQLLTRKAPIGYR